MKVRGLSFVVTNQCNFRCRYCYQAKNDERMSVATFRKALVSFLPRLTKDFSINFYGGEPLLCFGFIKKAVAFAEDIGLASGLGPRYSLTSNGSLLSAEAIRFFDKHRFALEISCDGTAQDLKRGRRSSAIVVGNIVRLLARPGIRLEVNSVFAPATVDHLSESARAILDLGVPSVQISISRSERWPKGALKRLGTEMKALRKLALEHYRITGAVGVANFGERRGRGFFFCAAGQDRFAVAPDGGIWGCFLFPGLFRGQEGTAEHRKYFFGRIDDLAKDAMTGLPGIAANYARLSLDNFTTRRGPCLFCPEFESCAPCPVAAALSGSPLGTIPDDLCEIQRIQLRERRELAAELSSAHGFEVPDTPECSQ